MDGSSWRIYTSKSAKSWTYAYSTDVSLAQNFHQRLPNFSTTPLVPLQQLARDLNIKGIYVKDESNRLGLPAFKILGASWGTFRAISAKANLPLTASLAQVSSFAKKTSISLYAATAGNHGRAVARMAKILDIPAHVFVPNFTDHETQRKIASEGAQVTVVEGDYEAAVSQADSSSKSNANSLLIEDTSFSGYEELPAWIVEGYSTMLHETEQQLRDLGLQPTILVTPVGVGSLAHAVVAFCKSSGRAIHVLAIEPETSACLNVSLQAGEATIIETSTTIMDGMNCSTVSPISWPVLRAGVDASVTITDLESHNAVQYLHAQGVNAGPCGAGALAGFRHVAADAPEAIGLQEDSVVVLLSTEGARAYQNPKADC
ncbi:hypothetical protein MMC06_000505 [Schaereria dolodes]|nr:hypothetical protein [Schaereria dolodes]